MRIGKNIIRLIFGLKVKHLREKMELSLDEFTSRTGISKSYLNEIEKGKKYPQADKILKIASVLNTNYDHLVSLKLEGELEQLSDILLSDKMQRIPLTSFGLDEATLSEMMINNPKKTQLMLSTLLNLTQDAGISKKDFLLSSGTAHKEAHDNYFQFLEDNGKDCRDQFNKEYDELNFENLSTYINDKFGISTQLLSELEISDIGIIQSIFVENKKLLLINPFLKETQKIFCLAKEAGNHCHKDNIDRVYSYPFDEYNTFDQVKNDIESTYFAKVFLMPKEKVVSEMNEWLEQSNVNYSKFEENFKKHNVSVSTYLNRLATLWKQAFGIEKYFMYSFIYDKVSGKFSLDFKLNLMDQNRPQVNEEIHHYCRKSIARNIILEFKDKNPLPNDYKFSIDLAKLNLHSTIIPLFAFTCVDINPLEPNTIRSIGISTLATPNVTDKIKFIKELSTIEVGYTCETCIFENCEYRESPPILIKKEEQNEILEQNIQSIIDLYSKK